MTYEREVVTRTDEDPTYVAHPGTTVAPPASTRTNQVVERAEVRRAVERCSGEWWS